jgi:hypothetical protein
LRAMGVTSSPIARKRAPTFLGSQQFLGSSRFLGPRA